MPILVVLALAQCWLTSPGWSVPMDRPGERSGSRLAMPWLAADGRTTAIGHGRRVTIHDRQATRLVEILLDAPGVSGALVGRSLLILDEEGTLLHLDVGDAAAGVTSLSARPAERPASLAAMGTTLLVEDRERGGVALLSIPPLSHRGHHGAPSPRRHGLEPVGSGFIPMTSPIIAMAAEDGSAAIAQEDGTLVVLENTAARNASAFDPATVTMRHIVLGMPARALALVSGRLYALAATGLVRIDLRDGEDPPRVIDVAAVEGIALSVAGREVTVLSEDATLTRVVDHTPAALEHNVAVLNNRFSPNMLTIFPGDSVSWSNASGYHNVLSCTTDQSGCTADATESFTSGFPGALWVVSHTFQQPGANPYVCQPHAPDMTGTVIVAPPPAPPPVPDGRDGAPMTVEPLDPNAASLEIAWDDVSCGTASSYHLIWGQRSHLPASPGGAFSLAGAVCGIATPFVWMNSPDPAAVPKRIIWWLILPDEGTTEGSWGVDALGAERMGPAAGGSSGVCGIVSKEVSAGCNP